MKRAKRMLLYVWGAMKWWLLKRRVKKVVHKAEDMVRNITGRRDVSLKLTLS